MREIDDTLRCFGEALADRFHEIVPPGGKVLEAGCGDGWQSFVFGTGQAGPVVVDGLLFPKPLASPTVFRPITI